MNYEKQLELLYKNDLNYYGVKKVFKGKVDRSKFFSIPGLIINTYGYYKNENDTWSVFVTDIERGVELLRRIVPTEEDAVNNLIKIYNSHNNIEDYEGD